MLYPKAVIFDMDGLLIDSEPIWHKAEIKVFGSVGLHLTQQQCYETTGIRIDDVVKLRYQQFPWTKKPLEQVENEIIDEVIRLIKMEGKALPGVYEILAFFEEKGIPMAVASSSCMRIIEAALERLGITDRFKVIHSAEGETFAKPHPAVYLSTATLLGIDPQSCLAFEDSLAGLIAAKAARMTCVSVPETRTTKFDFADLVLGSLTEFDEEAFWIVS